MTARSETSVTLQWENMDENWIYFLQINGRIFKVEPIGSRYVSETVSSLKPGTEYPYSVITVFSELNSTAFTGLTVTSIYQPSLSHTLLLISNPIKSTLFI